jgi:hypothetical protein
VQFLRPKATALIYTDINQADVADLIFNNDTVEPCPPHFPWAPKRLQPKNKEETRVPNNLTIWLIIQLKPQRKYSIGEANAKSWDINLCYGFGISIQTHMDKI